jgi:hypothetical protein
MVDILSCLVRCDLADYMKFSLGRNAHGQLVTGFFKAFTDLSFCAILARNLCMHALAKSLQSGRESTPNC